MRKMYLFKVAMLIMAVCALAMFNSSCEKENLEDLKQTSCIKKPRVVSDDEIMKDLPEVKDGRLVFKDSISYVNYVQWLFDNQGDRSKINEFNVSIGFVSMHEIYDKGLDLLNECECLTCSYIEEHPTVFYAVEVDGSIIHDMQALDIIGYIANEFGFFQVGEKIYRTTYNYIYCITNGDESKMHMLLNLNDEKTNDQYISSMPTFVRNVNVKGQYSYRTAYFSDNNYRVVARLRTGAVPNGPQLFYQAETDAQKKNKINIWVGHKLNGAWISWNNGYYVYQHINNTYTQNISAVEYGDTTLQKVTGNFCIYDNSCNVIEYASSLATTHTVRYGDEYAIVQYTNAFTASY